MDLDCDIDSFNPLDYNMNATSIHICAYVNESNVGDEDGNPPTNHWAAFLELKDNRSICIDMGPGYGSDGLRGKIALASRDCNHTQNAIKSLTFMVLGSVTVQMFIA